MFASRSLQIRYEAAFGPAGDRRDLREQVLHCLTETLYSGAPALVRVPHCQGISPSLDSALQDPSALRRLVAEPHITQQVTNDDTLDCS